LKIKSDICFFTKPAKASYPKPNATANSFYLLHNDLLCNPKGAIKPFSIQP